MKTLIAALLFAATAAHAALHERGNGLVYDDALNVTWFTQPLLSDRMELDQADAWVDALQAGGFTDWRLPKVLTAGPLGCLANTPGLCGFNPDPGSSELAFLHSQRPEWFAGQAFNFVMAAVPLACVAPELGWYCEVAPYRFVYMPFNDTQGVTYMPYDVGVLAVRDGDVISQAQQMTSAVPEPGAWALMLLGLAALAHARTARVPDSASRAAAKTLRARGDE